MIRFTNKFKYNLEMIKFRILNIAEALFVTIFASIIWCLFYGVYFTSGIKFVVDYEDTEWHEQMTWGPLI